MKHRIILSHFLCFSIVFALAVVAGCGRESLVQKYQRQLNAGVGVSLPATAKIVGISKSGSGTSTTWFVRFTAPKTDAKKYLDAIGFVEQSRGEGAVHDPSATYPTGTEWFYKSFKEGEDLSLANWELDKKKYIHAYVKDNGDPWTLAFEATVRE